MSGTARFSRLAYALGICAITPVSAQTVLMRDPGRIATSGASSLPQSAFGPAAGRTPETPAGRAGERRTRDQVIGIIPTARIQNRIPNRVQSRIANRLDRNYDPAADTTASFRSAGEETRSTSQRSKPR